MKYEYSYDDVRRVNGPSHAAVCIFLQFLGERYYVTYVKIAASFLYPRPPRGHLIA